MGTIEGLPNIGFGLFFIRFISISIVGTIVVFLFSYLSIHIVHGHIGAIRVGVMLSICWIGAALVINGPNHYGPWYDFLAIHLYL
jgi:hypothetical protein